MNKLNPKIIVALDFHSIKDAENVIAKLDPQYWRVKIGITLFTQAGPRWVESIQAKGFDVFLDLKFHDIPHQVEGACFEAAKLGVWMLNVHALGGQNMLLAAREGVDKANQQRSSRSILIAVTILTSLKKPDLEQIGIPQALPQQVLQLAQLTEHCGLDGIVCSAKEAQAVKSCTNQSFLCVTPGIRLPQDNHHDQARVVSPWEALKNGSDHLVMGRSITGAEDPNSVMKQIIQHL